MRAFERSGGDISIGWNWAAFLFTALWCVYRKMYGHASIIATIFIVLPLYAQLRVDWAQGSTVVVLLLWVACGLFGTTLYQHHVEGLIERSHKHSNDPARQLTYLRRAGGTNPWAVIPALVVFALAATFAEGYTASRLRAAAVPAPIQASPYPPPIIHEPAAPPPQQRQAAPPPVPSTATAGPAPRAEARPPAPSAEAQAQLAELRLAEAQILARYPYLGTPDGAFVREQIEEEAARLRSRGATPARALERAADMIAPYRGR